MSHPNPQYDPDNSYPEDYEADLADLRGDHEFCEKKLAEQEALRDCYPNLDKEKV